VTEARKTRPRRAAAQAAGLPRPARRHRPVPRSSEGAPRLSRSELAELRRKTQREALLDEAAAQFNARGISGTSINDVARRIGLTRAALYYYVDDRDDLMFQCYVRACQLTADDLSRADEEGADGPAKVEAFVRRALASDRPTAAVLSEIPYLAEPMRAVVEKANRRNVASLEGFIRTGIEDGSVRPCDAHVIAQAILGILNWVVLTPVWLGNDGASQPRIADALVEFFENGYAARRDAVVTCPVDVTSLATPPRNIFDRDAAAALKTEQVLATASHMFNQRGLDGVSLDDIAEALGATKGALYYYFSDKRDLITQCYDRAYTLNEQFTDVAEQTGRTGLERGMIGLHLNVQSQIGGPWPLVPLIGFESIAPRARKDFVRRMERLWERFSQFGREGNLDGSTRDCDIEALSLAGAGAFGWLPKWLPDADSTRRWEIADEMVKLFLHGLRRR
jgi:AcrR family transcriptional regulator